MDARLLSSYRWFRGRTGCVGRDAQAALDLARAELTARDAGCSWEWVHDSHGWADLVMDGWHAGSPTEVQTCEGCILRDADGAVLASLWAIWDADDDYRRQVQADLALQAQDALLAYSI